MKEHWSNYIGGQFWVGGWWWGSPTYVSFFREVCGLKLPPAIDAAALAYEQTCRSACWWWPHSQYVIVSERPTKIHLVDGQLHRDGGLAIVWPDGWGVYALNGVRVPEALVMTPSEQLDVYQWVVKEQNAEIRREAVRKIGIERVCHALKAKTIATGVDHVGAPCELLSLDLGDGRMRPYIKMRNPSVPGVYHLEGRPPGTKTVAEALRAQQPVAMQKLPISEQGDDWWQQGDVFVWPKGAMSLKPKPVILT